MDLEIVKSNLSGVTSRLPLEKQLSWLQLAEAKQINMDLLTKKELEAQAHLLNYENIGLVQLENGISEYKKTVNEIPVIRKGFTKYMDMITTEMMTVEKRAAVWENFTKASELLIQKKLEKEKTDAESNAKLQEAERFKIHIKNQNARRLAQYQLDLAKSVTDSYTMALNDDTLDEAGIKRYLEITSLALQEVKIIAPEKFEYKLHTVDELKVIQSGVEAPVWGDQLTKALHEMGERFKMYFHDRANKESAKKHIAEDHNKQEIFIKDSLKATESINNLVFSSISSTFLVANDGAKQLKRTKSIKVEDGSEVWCKIIVSSFVANWNVCFPLLRTKKYGNLSVSQMASALDAAQVKVAGVEYEERIK